VLVAHRARALAPPLRALLASPWGGMLLVLPPYLHMPSQHRTNDQGSALPFFAGLAMPTLASERAGAAGRPATRAWLDILRGAWMVLPAAPAPSEVVAMVRESKGGQEEEEELAWLEALAGCLGAAVALARGEDEMDNHVGGTVEGKCVSVAGLCALGA
jgi:hypothetical protein